MNRRYCLTLDLQDDPKLIDEYKLYHEKIWPEVEQSLKASGVESAEIYVLGTRLFMILEVTDQFSFAAKAKADLQNPKVREWEALMWRYQRPLPQAKPGEKWLLMERIFKLQ